MYSLNKLDRRGFYEYVYVFVYPEQGCTQITIFGVEIWTFEKLLTIFPFFFFFAHRPKNLIENVIFSDFLQF